MTTPQGFRAAGLAAGIKPDGKKDMGLLVSDVPATVAAVFTTNRVKAAPVIVSAEHARHGTGRAVIVNSGNANACTGEDGLLHARAMTEAVARRIGCPATQVFVCSTGRIGVKLPIVKVQAGIKQLLGALQPHGGHALAEAMMTSDTVPKEIAVHVSYRGRTVCIGGVAKGAGMIHPHMATMLCLLTTDAALTRAMAQRTLHRAVEQSFNRISVDGDMSTNDTVILLANGMAGSIPAPLFQDALNHVCLELAHMIVRDGEGCSKFVTVEVRGAASDRDADRAARAVANSVLVKTSWCGGDPNWGRIMDALGYSGARFDPLRVEIFYDNLPAVRRGIAARTPVDSLRAVLARPSFRVTIHLHEGTSRAVVYTTDLTENYVTFNKGE
ncbi:MAG: bifunctional glutamate N-acetyltransferase/amino-acid acetyltransferase ArgJ [Verrucomicrobiae bacterium]|nr:bifunctional glutamate N-acetyltransferase/amino-acid acetyltransferase ArgJ [Verrucomicrobiae bacterium]